VEHLEALSDYLKKNRFRYEDYLDAARVAGLAPAVPRAAGWVSRVQRLARPVRLQQPCWVQSLAGDRDMLIQAGVQLAPEIEILLDNTLLQMANLYKVKRLRFWGKFLGLQDYYVLQGTSGLEYDDQLAKGQEPRGEGANLHTYWVTTDLNAGWVELPQVTPEQVKLARLIKHIVRGELEADVQGYPKFPGKEKHFLKAQIVRITHACELAPKGLYKMHEENPK
jgi:radial spoke head protein 4A